MSLAPAAFKDGLVGKDEGSWRRVAMDGVAMAVRAALAELALREGCVGLAAVRW